MKTTPDNDDYIDDVEALSASFEVGETGFEKEESHHRLRGEAITVFVGLSLAIITFILLPWATQNAPAGKGWWTQPWLAPLYALTITVIAGSLYARHLWLLGAFKKGFHALWTELKQLGQPLEISIYFSLYVYGTNYLGYVLSTFLFAIICLWRSQLLTWRSFGFAVLLTVLLVLIFRVFLGIWFPPAEAYQFLPDALRSFALRYL